MLQDSFLNPLLTDLYQLTMVYAYWKAGRHNLPATFDMIFRQCPFGGEFAVFGGLSKLISLLNNFHFRDERLDMVKQVMPPGCEPAFYEWLEKIDASDLCVEAVPEGCVVFPKVPLITVSGPLAVAQLLETPLLNSVNFPTLMATNAARFRLAVGPDKKLFELGLRRAQGPNGGMTASEYAYIGGFDGTSNVFASFLYSIPCRGTHAHSYVESYSSLDELPTDNLLLRVLFWRNKLADDGIIPTAKTSNSELAAFISYAKAFPNCFLALVDTFNTLKSGIPNFLAVALALNETSARPIGIRLDSGDLAYLSNEARAMFIAVSQKYHVDFQKLTIVASNNINERVLYQLRLDGHEIDTFGIGTDLVTCAGQPALGGVYKLVEINGHPKLKRSEDSGKIPISGRKRVMRLFTGYGYAFADLMTRYNDPLPVSLASVTCYHPFDPLKKMVCVPSVVKELQQPVWLGRKVNDHLWSPIEVVRERVERELKHLRADHLRALNPTPYKVSVTKALYDEFHELLERETVG